MYSAPRCWGRDTKPHWHAIREYKSVATLLVISKFLPPRNAVNIEWFRRLKSERENAKMFYPVQINSMFLISADKNS